MSEQHPGHRWLADLQPWQRKVLARLTRVTRDGRVVARRLVIRVPRKRT
jgi:hypothetical protein